MALRLLLGDRVRILKPQDGTKTSTASIKRSDLAVGIISRADAKTDTGETLPPRP